MTTQKQTEETPETLSASEIGWFAVLNKCKELEIKNKIWEQWAREVLIDFKIQFDDNAIQMRHAIVQRMCENQISMESSRKNY